MIYKGEKRVMKKKIIILSLFLITILTFSGCSKTEQTNNKNRERNEKVESYNDKPVTEVTEEKETRKDKKKEKEEKKISIELTAQNPDVQLSVGEQNKLFYTSSNQDVEVKYVSSDDSVATVDDNGVVTAVGSGTATITASYNDASCEWTITSIPAEFALYKKFIEDKGYMAQAYEGDIPTYNDIQFAVADINNDGIYDLIIKSLDNNYGCVGNANLFYTYKNGQVVYCNYQTGFLEKYDPEQQMSVWIIGLDRSRLFDIEIMKVESDLNIEKTGIYYTWEDPNLEHVGEEVNSDIYKKYGKYWVLFWNPDEENLNKLTSDYFISEQYQTDQINGINEEEY